MILSRLLSLFLGLAAMSAAAPADEPVRSKLSCSDLRAFTGYDFSIATATVIPATDDVPEHCRVSGQKRLFPGWPVGAEAAGPNGRPGWEGWIVRDDARTTQINFLETFLRYMAFPEKDPNYDWGRFNVETDPSRMEWIRKVRDATDPDLASFKATGGKILMYYGWADPALNARMGVEYYEKVLDRMGPATTEFFRLFMVPGMFHCGGGLGLNTFDWLTPLIEWVEKGVAPDLIVGSRVVEGKVTWKRPVCPYSKTARYKGTGSIDDSDAFECR